MNWLDKVKMLRALKKNRKVGETRVDICLCESSWSKGELEKLEEKLTWIPKIYIDYIREFDSTSVAWCNFFGSQKCDGISIEKQIEEHKDILKNDYFPFAKYPDGSIFLLNQKSEVLWWDKSDYDFEKPKFIAASFDEFMSECLLGKRYGEFSFAETSTFYKTLQAQGWV